jgi:FG-GAP repeat protein/VCBS repeat protein
VPVGDGGSPDAAVCAGAPADAPRLLSPWNGTYTGSLFAPGTLRPRFRWRGVTLPDGSPASYEIQIDDSCPVGGHAACEMPSPAIDQHVGATELVPADDLAVETANRPLGTRYAWRVRACDACEACGPWSAGRYVLVGREAADFDGDGYADLLVGAFGEDDTQVDEGAVYAYASAAVVAAVGEVAPTATVANPVPQGGATFGQSIAYVGDVNGDGFPDVAIGAPVEDAPEGDEGLVHLFLGGAAGLVTPPAESVDHPFDLPGAFGYAVAAAGDVDADGYADVVVGAPRDDDGATEAGRGYVFRGGPAGIDLWPTWDLPNPRPEAYALYGVRLAPAGDVDADGYADLVVGAPYDLTNSDAPGYACVYRGGPDGPSSVPDLVIDSPTAQVDGRFGLPVAGLGDLDGDGFGDVAIGAPLEDGAEADDGVVRIYLGGEAGLRTPEVAVLTGSAGSTFGSDVSTGDVNGDGRIDLLTSGYSITGTFAAEGEAFIYLGAGDGTFPDPPTALPSPAPQLSGWFGLRVGVAGDVDGDGADDFVVGAEGEDSGLVLDVGSAWLYRGGATFEPLPLRQTADEGGDSFGHDVPKGLP